MGNPVDIVKAFTDDWNEFNQIFCHASVQLQQTIIFAWNLAGP